MNYVLSLLLLGFFLYGLIDTALQGFRNINYMTVVFVLSLGVAVIFFRKARNKRIFIRVNKTGIYQDEQLVTGWANFLNAYISQKDKVFRVQDNFILVVEFLKEGNAKGFRRKIPLTNTQDKSEEDVLAAVKFFWSEYRGNVL